MTMADPIRKVKFSLLSQEEIQKGINIRSFSQTEQFGATRTEACKICTKDYLECTGHNAYYSLHSHIYLMVPYILRILVNVLSCVCHNSACNKLLFSEYELQVRNTPLPKAKDARISELAKKAQKQCVHCNAKQESYSIETNNQGIRYGDSFLDPNTAYMILSRVPKEQLALLGYVKTHPKDLIPKHIPIIPLVARPPIMMGGVETPDDITTLYESLLKMDQMYAAEKNHMNLLRIQSIFTSMISSSGKVYRNTVKIVQAFERLMFKHGLIRSNLMGTRTQHAARTVVSPDPKLDANQIAIPEVMEWYLTVPEVVNKMNLSRLSKLLDQGKIPIVQRGPMRISVEARMYTNRIKLHYGDTVYRNGVEIEVDSVKQLKDGDTIVRRDGTVEENITLYTKNPFSLQLYDTAHRRIHDGDIVIVNRQPTLHLGSMFACLVKIDPHRRTIGVALNITTPMNMDFDGDEANIYVPQTLEAIAEAHEIMSVQANVITPQSSKPMIGVVQDTMISLYKMTSGWVEVSKSIFCDIVTYVDLDINRMKHISLVYNTILGEDHLYTGHGLVSMCLPEDFHYNTDGVLIQMGVMLSGTLSKKTMGPVMGAIHHVMNPEDRVPFLSKIQKVATQWLQHQGMSISLEDCYLETMDAEWNVPGVRENNEHAFAKADAIEETIMSPLIREMKTLTALTNARSLNQKIVAETIPASNQLFQYIDSGAKGSMSNITQIMVGLGQQTVNGKRIMGFDGKTLPVKQDKYLQNGFISRSFLQGLSGTEFWYHATSGREGITITACTTAKNGYVQRRMTEALKNLKVEYDGTVRNATGRIVQFAYNKGGVDPTKQRKINRELQLDVTSLVNNLTSAHQSKLLFEKKQYQANTNNIREDTGLIDEVESDYDDALEWGSDDEIEYD